MCQNWINVGYLFRKGNYRKFIRAKIGNQPEDPGDKTTGQIFIPHGFL